jgi:uncharacterized protein YdeI (YjbR/CyaY-like superfamily)
MPPIFFKTPDEFRKWLEINHANETELLVGFYKKESKRPSITWPQSVDEALCFGWIDGVRKSIDEESYSIRFTPRKPSSIWSAINIKKVEDLIKSGKMNPAGLSAFNKRREEKSKIYSFESELKLLTEDFEKEFRASKTAWKFFDSQAPSYKKTIIHWIMTASQDKTRLSRLRKVIAESEKQTRLWEKYR